MFQKEICQFVFGGKTYTSVRSSIVNVTIEILSEILERLKIFCRLIFILSVKRY